MSKRTRIAVIGLALAALATAAPAAEETFVFDRNHSLVGFRIRHVVSKVDGRFRDYDGTIWIDRQNPAASKVELTIQSASIDTGVADRDNHLRSPDFFDAARFPTITFKSTKVEPKGADAYEVTGDFTMRGVTKTIRVPVRHGGFARVGKEEKTGFEAVLTLNRKDYGITWNRTIDQGGLLLGEEVEITVQVEANRKEPEAPKTGGGR